MASKKWLIPALASLLLNHSSLADEDPVEPLPEEIIEEPIAREYQIDVSDHFIPEIIAESEHAEMYFYDINQLNELFGRNVFHDYHDRERFGMYDTFQPYIEDLQDKTANYNEAIEERGDLPQPTITIEDSIEHDFTTDRTSRRIDSLLSIPERTSRQERSLQRYLERVNLVKDIQTILSWEDFYEGEINGNYADTWPAVQSYQEFHRLDDDGVIGEDTRQLLNTSLENLLNNSHQDLLGIFEERVFHTTYVIEQDILGQLTIEAANQLGINNPEGALSFFSNPERPEMVTVELSVPERYTQDFLDLHIQVIKSERNRRNTRLELYNGEDLLFSTRAVVGGRHIVHGRRRNFPTPEGEFYLRRLIVFPSWFPPEWADEQLGDSITQPGFQNAYGILAMPLSRSPRLAENPYVGRISGDLLWLNHMTPFPESVESGHGKSHGCIRVHPDRGNHLFYFLIRYTPHLPLGDADYRGEVIPFLRAIPFEIIM